MAIGSDQAVSRAAALNCTEGGTWSGDPAVEAAALAGAVVAASAATDR
jgi:hypothetical protein